MVVKEYYQSIDTHSPKGYFERWYTDVWCRRIGTPTAAPGVLKSILVEELEQYNAEIGYTESGYRYKVSFADDAKYTMFVLRWA